MSSGSCFPENEDGKALSLAPSENYCQYYNKRAPAWQMGGEGGIERDRTVIVLKWVKVNRLFALSCLPTDQITMSSGDGRKSFQLIRLKYSDEQRYQAPFQACTLAYLFNV